MWTILEAQLPINENYAILAWIFKYVAAIIFISLILLLVVCVTMCICAFLHRLYKYFIKFSEDLYYDVKDLFN
jgi:hypothetical protein